MVNHPDHQQFIDIYRTFSVETIQIIQCHGELPQMLGPKGDAQGRRHDAQQATVAWRRNDHRGTMG